MTVVNIEEAKDHLAELLSEAAKGREVVIEAVDGSMVELVPSEPKKRRGFVGSGKGWFDARGFRRASRRIRRRVK